MGWGTSWDKPEIVFVGVDLGASDSQTVLTTFEDGELKHRVIPQDELYEVKTLDDNILDISKVEPIDVSKIPKLNKVPTHDPYTNPNAFIYYECECGQILDPRTKRFAELNNCASKAGWKIRWGSQHYIPYCVECAKEKGIE